MLEHKTTGITSDTTRKNISPSTFDQKSAQSEGYYQSEEYYRTLPGDESDSPSSNGMKEEIRHQQEAASDLNAGLKALVRSNAAFHQKLEPWKDASHTGVYFLRNLNFLIKITNDVTKFFVGAPIIGTTNSFIKIVVPTIHTSVSTIDSFVAFVTTDSYDFLKPIVNTVIFNMRKHTDYLESDNALVQCSIDAVSNAASHLVFFSPHNAVAAVGFTGAKCAVKYYDGPESSILPVIDLFHMCVNLATPSNVAIKTVEGIKGVYAACNLISSVPFSTEASGQLHEGHVDL